MTSSDEVKSSKTLVFIDTNAWKPLFSATRVASKFAEDVLRMKTLLFPRIVADEIMRNKVDWAAQLLPDTLQAPTAIHDAWPEDLKETVGQAKDNIRELEARLKTLRSDFLRSVALSEDSISRALGALQVAEPTNEELSKARYRREVGNQPGKRSDPLGDQICWEMILRRMRRTPDQTLWLVTQDRDYLAKTGEDCARLNPLLWNDLVRATGFAPEVRVFKDLGSFVGQWKAGGHDSSLDAEEVDDLRAAAEFAANAAALAADVGPISNLSLVAALLSGLGKGFLVKDHREQILEDQQAALHAKMKALIALEEE